MTIWVQQTGLELSTADPAGLDVDALIHPTNNYFWFASGFSDWLKQRGGDNLETEAIALGPVNVGEARLAPAGRLKCRYIIHTAAWGQDMMTDRKKVRKAIQSALKLVAEKKCASLALPMVGVGMGQFSLAAAIEVSFFSVVEHCMLATPLKRVVFLAANSTEKQVLSQMFQTALSAGATLEPEGSS